MNARMENYGQLIKSGLDTQDAEAIQKISRSLHRIDENDCNGYSNWRGDWDEIAEKRAEKRCENLEAKGKLIADKYGLIFYHQSDPRGWSVYLVHPEKLNGYKVDSMYSSAGIAVCSQ